MCNYLQPSLYIYLMIWYQNYVMIDHEPDEFLSGYFRPLGTSFLKSMSARGGSAIERHWIWILNRFWVDLKFFFSILKICVQKLSHKLCDIMQQLSNSQRKLKPGASTNRFWCLDSWFDKIKQFDYIQWFILFYVTVLFYSNRTVLFSTGLQKCSVNDSSASSFDISNFAWWRSVESISISQLVFPSSTPGCSSGQNNSFTAWHSIALSFGLRKITVAITKKCVKMCSSTSKFSNWRFSMKL